uniref:Uncharacterized protein n=1 Tax=Solanum tuberosum TaxID=4113 RepID=M1CDH3_SOLTU
MEKVDMKELCPCQDKERYHELGSALEGCVHFNEDYKMLLLYIEQGRIAYGGYNPRPTSTDVEDGILSKKRGNEDRDLDNRKQRIDMEIVPGNEQTMKDGILSNRRGNEDRGLDNRNHRIDMEIVPGKEQKIKDGILSKKQLNKDRDLDSRNHRIDVNILPGKEQTMKDGILSKKQQNEDRDLDNRKQRIDVNIIPGMEQRTQNDSKLMDAEVKIEPQEDSDSIKEAESESEVEILENVDSRYRKEVLNLLMTPYNGEEYKKLWKDIRMRLPSSSRNGRGKSLLSLHKGRLIACGLFSSIVASFRILNVLNCSQAIP